MFKRFFGNKFVGLFLASLASAAITMVFDEIRDEKRVTEIIEQTVEITLKKKEEKEKTYKRR